MKRLRRLFLLLMVFVMYSQALTVNADGEHGLHSAVNAPSSTYTGGPGGGELSVAESCAVAFQPLMYSDTGLGSEETYLERAASAYKSIVSTTLNQGVWARNIDPFYNHYIVFIEPAGNIGYGDGMDYYNPDKVFGTGSNTASLVRYLARSPGNGGSGSPIFTDDVFIQLYTTVCQRFGVSRYATEFNSRISVSKDPEEWISQDIFALKWVKGVAFRPLDDTSKTYVYWTNYLPTRTGSSSKGMVSSYPYMVPNSMIAINAYYGFSAVQSGLNNSTIPKWYLKIDNNYVTQSGIDSLSDTWKTTQFTAIADELRNARNFNKLFSSGGWEQWITGYNMYGDDALYIKYGGEKQPTYYYRYTTNGSNMILYNNDLYLEGVQNLHIWGLGLWVYGMNDVSGNPSPGGGGGTPTPTYKFGFAVNATPKESSTAIGQVDSSIWEVAINKYPSDTTSENYITGHADSDYTLTVTATTNTTKPGTAERVPTPSQARSAIDISGNVIVNSTDITVDSATVGADGKVTIKLSGKLGAFQRMFGEDPSITFTTSVSPVTNNSAKSSFHRMNFTMSLDPANPELKSISGRPVAASFDGWSYSGSSGNNWASWNITNVRKIPWDFHTDVNASAYAEILANEVGFRHNGNQIYDGNTNNLSQDWNVLQGIPSTEKLAIAAGGSAFQVDAGGYVYLFGMGRPELTAIDGASVAAADSWWATGQAGNASTYNSLLSTSGGFERTGWFDVILMNVWGDTQSTPESLHCDGHTFTGSWTVPVPGDLGEGAGPNGTSQSFTCDGCGQTITFTWGGGENAVEEKRDPVTGEVTQEAKDAVKGKWDQSAHSCNITLKFDCSTGEWSASGSSSGSITSQTSTMRSTNQGYDGTATWTGSGGATVSGNVTIAEIDRGYTVQGSYGCKCDNGTSNVTMAHGHNVTIDTGYVHELISGYAYRSITNLVIDALEGADITAVNTNLIDSSYIGEGSTNANLRIALWRGKETNTGTYVGYDPAAANGRFFFTTYNGAKGWKGNIMDDGSDPGACGDIGYSATYGGTPTISGWLGNYKIHVEVSADRKNELYENQGSFEQLWNSGAYSSASIRLHAGFKDGHYIPTATAGSTWQSNPFPGDYATGDELKRMAVNMSNVWLYNHRDNLFTANVISDNLDAGLMGTDSSHGVFQNMIGEIYGVDTGIKLYNTPFTSTNASDNQIYRVHFLYDNVMNVATTIAANNMSGVDINTSAASQMKAGYSGIITENPSLKYVGNFPIDGYSRYLKNTMSYCMALTDHDTPEERRYINYGGQNTMFGDAVGDLENRYMIYSTAVDPKKDVTNNLPNKSGITIWTMTVEGSKTGEQVDNAYYRDHKYVANGNFSVSWKINGQPFTLPSGSTTRNYTNSGDLNYNSIIDYGNGQYGSYGSILAMQNIDMKLTAPNGTYNQPVTVKCYWIQVINMDQGGGTLTAKVNTASNNRSLVKTAAYTSGYTNTASVSGVINDVIVHDPISAQYVQVISNNYGDYDGDGPAIDESKEDFRATSDGVPETEKPRYMVLGNTFHMWWSDIGDLYDGRGNWSSYGASYNRGVGSTQNGCDPVTGVINSNARGYTNNMNTAMWVKERYVTFSFPVSYRSISGETKIVGANTEIPLSDVMANTADKQYAGYLKKDSNGAYSIPSVSGLLHYGSDALQNFWLNSELANQMAYEAALNGAEEVESPITDEEFKLGYDFEFTILTSALEEKEAEISWRSVAINDNGNTETDVNSNANRYTNYAALHQVKGQQWIETVGRIGNLALEDVGDFRFSELFKKAEDMNDWLITGVIHRTNIMIPNTIGGTSRDILEQTVTHSGVNSSHSTLSSTNYSYGTTVDLGKAGNWFELPLVAYKNTIKEYQDEQMRLGYDAYFDIETIGNYYGDNDVQGPLSVRDIIDEREHVMTIIPRYYLYDYDDGKLYDVDMYAGVQGQRYIFYNSSPYYTEMEDVAALYVDMSTERYRRNATDYEYLITDKVLANSTQLEKAVKTSASKGEVDYIGTASLIVLDQFDLDYIGSSIERGGIWYNPNSGAITSSGKSLVGNNPTKASDIMFDAGRIAEGNFAEQSQRWYFTLGLPSSTYITKPGAGSDQLDIEKKHEELFKEHPHSILIAYLEIRVSGSVWDLEYDASHFGDISVRLFPDDKIPEEWPDDGEPVIPEEPDIYDPNNPGGDPTGKIPRKWVPVIVFDPNSEHSSTYDWDTYGTH